MKTPWKKSRKFGDVYGGRGSPKLKDNFFKKLHGFKAPTEDQETPIISFDNPGRYYFYPLCLEDIQNTLKILPSEHWQGLTHIVFQKPNNWQQNTFGSFCWGGGCYIVFIMPLRKDLILDIGPSKSNGKLLGDLKRVGATISKKDKNYFAKFDNFSARQFFLNSVFLHEIGHYVELFVHDKDKTCEEFANQYALEWGRKVHS